MATTDQVFLTEQHRSTEAGIMGLVDGSGSRQELTDGVNLLRRHIYVEEAFLFPVIEQDYRRWMPLAQMRHEHGDMWPHIESAVRLLAAYAPLDDLMPASEALMALLGFHDRREEEAIYTAADNYRASPGHPPIQQLFTTTDIPVGWRCRYAPG